MSPASPDRPASPSYESLLALFEHTPNGIAMLDDGGRTVFANAALAILLGVPVDRLAGRTLEEFCVDARSAPAGGDPSQLADRSVAPPPPPPREVRIERPDGTVAWGAIAYSVASGADGVARIAIVHDLTLQKEAEARLALQAFQDPLTGLSNRVRFRERVEHAVERAVRDEERIAILLLDLDGFKVVNDTWGHDVGDKLLQLVARRLQSATRGCDTVARLGGDEFGILLEDIDVRVGAQTVANRILEAFRLPFVIDGGIITTVGGSIGIAIHYETEEVDHLTRRADVAMYEAKQSRSRYVVHDPLVPEALADRVTLETDLRRAVELPSAPGELSVVYQPVVSLATGEIVAVEALARWTHPARGSIPTAVFLPIAERTDLICDLGRIVLRQASREIASVNALRGERPVTLMVNVSERQLVAEAFPEMIGELLLESRLEPRRLMLDIAEATIMRHPDSTHGRLRQLDRLGVGIAIDNFGSGYSSIASMQRFPVDAVKISRGFTADIRGDGEGTALARTAIALAHNLGLRAIALGVEQPMQRDVLRDLGCDWAQGFLLGHPLTATELVAALAG